MANTDDELLEAALATAPEDLDSEHLKALRGAAERGKKASTENETLKLRLAASEAGIDTSTRKGQAWLDSYTGKVEPEAMLADAQDFDPSLIRAQAAAPASAAGATGDGAGATPEGEAGTQPGAEGAQQVIDDGTAARTALADGAIPAGAATRGVSEQALEGGRLAAETGSEEDGIATFLASKARGIMAHPEEQTLDRFGMRLQPAQ